MGGTSIKQKRKRGSKMKEYNLSTSRGKQLYNIGITCCWSSLNNLYNKWSEAKQQAFNRCWAQYCKGENSTAFGVGNSNKFGFTASWLETINNEEVMRIETKDNSYLVWLNR